MDKELGEKIEFQVAEAMNTTLEIEKSSLFASQTAKQFRIQKTRKDITAQILALIKEAGYAKLETFADLKARARKRPDLIIEDE